MSSFAETDYSQNKGVRKEKRHIGEEDHEAKEHAREEWSNELKVLNCFGKLL